MTGRRLRFLVVAGVLLANVFATVPSAADSEPTRFSDVAEGAWFGDAVAWATEAGVVYGFTERCFLPGEHATRAQAVAILHRSLGSPAPSAPHDFTDLTGTWQEEAVSWAASTGVTVGTTDTTFDPDRPATRAEVAAFIWRAAGRPPSGPVPFVDVTQAWQRTAVGWMAKEGITHGRTPTHFDPEALVTRSELAVFIWRWNGHPEAPELVAGPERNCLVDTRRCSALFGEATVAAWRATYPGARFTAAVHDHRTGCEYHLEPALQLTTASVIKAQVLAGVLLRAQDDARALTPGEVANIDLMIRYSHNRPPTSELYLQIGSARGMEAIDARFGIAGTAHTARYGATLSSAEDRTRLVEQLLIGGGPLDEASVAEAWEWMSTVSTAQTWGISAGLPADHEFALKNGFYPMSGRGWRLGTSGVVIDADGGAYAMTIMTDLNPDEATGIELVEQIARHVNERLTAGAPAPRAHDSITCLETSANSSWSAAAVALGSVDASTLQLLNGGEAAPLNGQRVCRP